VTDIPDVDVLDGLTVQQQRALLDRLSHKLSSAKVEWKPEHHALWSAVCAHVDSDRRLLPAMPQFVKSYGVKRFKIACDVFRDFVSSACPTKMRRVERAAVESLVAGCLASELRRGGRPVTPTTMLDMMAFLAGCVNRDFPGYASARMLHRVVAAREHV